MKMEKKVLSVITTKKYHDKVGGGAPTFYCDSTEEMEKVAANLEAIIDGIAHELTQDLYVIVKH